MKLTIVILTIVILAKENGLLSESTVTSLLSFKMFLTNLSQFCIFIIPSSAPDLSTFTWQSKNKSL